MVQFGVVVSDAPLCDLGQIILPKMQYYSRVYEYLNSQSPISKAIDKEACKHVSTNRYQENALCVESIDHRIVLLPDPATAMLVLESAPKQHLLSETFRLPRAVIDRKGRTVAALSVGVYLKLWPISDRYES